MRLWLPILALLFGPTNAKAGDFFTLEGHGGPIKGIDVSADGQSVATASFDYSVGYWNGGAPVWLEGHRAAVNTVLFLDGRRIASAGDDFDIRIWNLEDGGSEVLAGHTAKIMDIAVSPGADLLASASWDARIGLWSLDDGSVRWLEGHDAGVNAVAFSADGRFLYSVSTDGSLRRWSVDDGAQAQVVLRHGFGINTMVLAEEKGWLAYGAVDGGTRVIDLKTGDEIVDLTAERRPILAMAAPTDFGHLAVGDGEGYIMIVDTADWSIARDFRAAKRGPIWALHYAVDGENIHAGGIDDAMFSWPVDDQIETAMATGERSFLRKPETMSNGERQFQRKCSICHVLTGDTARRAGPTLEGLFGRKAASVEGYAYSDAMTSSELVWSDETIDDLFEIGPDHYIPGTKMPMQRIARQEDRDDLIEFLKTATLP